MAYLAFQELGGAPAAAAIARDCDALSALEWSVVAIARADPLSSLSAHGPVARLARMLFNRANPMLADPRLEALRRAAVLTWRGGAAARAVPALLDAGFTPDQCRALFDGIAALRDAQASASVASVR